MEILNTTPDFTIRNMPEEDLKKLEEEWKLREENKNAEIKQNEKTREERIKSACEIINSYHWKGKLKGTSEESSTCVDGGSKENTPPNTQC